MQDWYYSGIEGYCKAAAQMMGLPNDNSGWGNFGSDIFSGERFSDPAKASKTWKLSRLRSTGRSNRPKLFEQSWLGRTGIDCEMEAVHTCVHAMCANDAASALYELYQQKGAAFAAEFRNKVMPAIEDGFTTERYRASDIARFSLGIDRSLINLDLELPQTFRHFAALLVAGLIYGPDSSIAQYNVTSSTLRSPNGVDDLESCLFGFDLGSIVLTQTFSGDFAFIGRSDVFTGGQVVFLGRGSDIGAYSKAWSLEFADAIHAEDAVVFPISRTHKSVSKEHGVIARIDDTWYYHDFSANGTLVENAEQVVAVHRRAVALMPGDRLHLGLAEPTAGEVAAHHHAASLLVSFRVDELCFEGSLASS